MQRFQGKGIAGGFAIGPIEIYKSSETAIICKRIEAVELEVQRFYLAIGQAKIQLKGLYEMAVQELGKKDADIFEMHILLLEDQEFQEFVQKMIREKRVNAEYAVMAAGEYYSKAFAGLEEEYMQARAADIRDISVRLINILSGKEEQQILAKEPVILVAEDLTPSETVRLDKEKVLALVTKEGDVNSHTAILARTMGIPALVGVKMPISGTWEQSLGIVDSANGYFYVEPDAATLEAIRKEQQSYLQRMHLLLELREQETITLDGRKVQLAANIASLQDLEQVFDNGAEGIGLFRSESIYLAARTFPTEEEQFRIYKKLAEKMQGKPVVIRTLDIGADKQCDYFVMEKEENPALGCRAIRLCLKHPELFKTQIRALLRAGVYGNLSVLYPMIISLEEVRTIRTLLQECEAELSAEGILYGKLKQGIMIETPAAVMLSEELAKEVDFFSIGTNDLTQYTLAIDRQNAKLEKFYDPYHPAVLRMIEMVVMSAHKAGIRVSICGELGADRKLTKEFLAMGVDELSVAPTNILPLRKFIREMKVDNSK